MKASLCPVCNGSGKLSSGGGTNDLTCHGCDGKGWVEVREDTYISCDPYPWYPNYPGSYGDSPYVDRCPACGQDRNAPSLAGCPLGSHYGTYVSF